MNRQINLGVSMIGLGYHPAAWRHPQTPAGTFDEAKREALVQAATRMAVADVAVIPIFHMKASRGLRRGLTMQARGDQFTYASDVRPP